jgi:hypothetical protein
MTDPTRIRQLMLDNLFAVFNVRDPEQEPAVSGIDVGMVRDGKIAVLHTLLTDQR